MEPKQPTEFSANNQVYFSCAIADLALRACLEPEAGSPPRKAITTIVLSVEALEGTINEIIHDANIFVQGNANLGIRVNDGLKHFVNVLHELGDRTPLETKFILASELIGGSAYVKGKRPFNDFNFLVRLRSALIHSRTDGFVYTDNVALSSHHYNLLSSLVERGLIHGGTNPFTSVEANENISRWAFSTSCLMSKSIIEMCRNAGMRVTLEKEYLETYSFVR
jgi:hypothetical protein